MLYRSASVVSGYILGLFGSGFAKPPGRLHLETNFWQGLVNPLGGFIPGGFTFCIL